MTKLKTILAAWLFGLAGIITIATVSGSDITHTLLPLYWFSVAVYWGIGVIS